MKPESELLAHIYARSKHIARGHPRIVTGPGDDCAVLRAAADPAAPALLLTVDQLVEGRHYDADRTSIDHIARKAVARSVSDIAAMGGRPVAALATGALRDTFDNENELFDAMARWGAHWGCPLIGGDIARTEGPSVLTVTIVGEPHAVRGPVLRSGARPGDGVYVTGALGGSLGADGQGRHLTFDPRIDEGAWLCDALADRLHAMIDLSDGLGRDAGRIASASGVRIELDAALLPIAPAAAGWRAALADGEDYELCFCIDPVGGDVPARTPTGLPITRVGSVIEGAGCVVRTPEGDTIDAAELGWDHGA
ncbi:MAG: thiamine-phosphate kinase [Phycisphaerales bacterium]|nr:MAG: thiamine-phosphate kinase [Phycisphaerales bacterium]